MVIVKLNGGLGTSMGCRFAKNLIPIKGELNFFDLMARQVEQLNQEFGVQIPLIFMSSYSTHLESINYLKKYGISLRGKPGPDGDYLDQDFIQNMFPRLDVSTNLPLDFVEQELNWYPPGHGDIYNALGDLLPRLLKNGYQYLFVSNGDNLGATVEPAILGYFAHADLAYCSETTRRTPKDVKGGSFILNQATGRLELLEKPLLEKGREREYADTEKYRYFNTNSLWLDLVKLEKNGLNPADLPLIANIKKVEGVVSDINGNEDKDLAVRECVQLETAMATAIRQFEESAIIDVPRTRFYPVKYNSDLLLNQSDYTVLSGVLKEKIVLNPAREKPEVIPDVDLDPVFFASLEEYNLRVTEAPSLVNLDKLTVRGRVMFSDRITLRGEVAIINQLEDEKKELLLGAEMLLEDVEVVVSREMWLICRFVSKRGKIDSLVKLINLNKHLKLIDVRIDH